ncbi:hypothetical protein [Polymorphobacter sp.]|uniref:hypothetical protein n=1 Tax=Polymorphobacter sp. TaxID=1909290 RepID=UPI003F70395F
MAMLVVVLLFGTTVMLGGYMAWQYWCGVRAAKAMSAAHLLLAAAGLEGLALLLRGAPDGTRAPGGDWSTIAGLGLAAAFLTGLLVPLIAKPKPAAAGNLIIAHASIATIAFCARMWWLMRG